MKTPSQTGWRRRDLIAGALGTAIASTAASALPRIADPYMEFDATDLAKLVATRQVSPVELLEAAIARVERLNPTLNAVVTTFYDQARAVACAPLPDGPFRGVPYLVKDLDNIAGTRAAFGSRLMLANTSTATDTIIERSIAAGLVPFGKTNTPEFALSASTEPLAFGPTHNPWDLLRSSGGSSGGSASAVAAGLVPMAHGNDGGGSLRIPASCCGVFALKPSRGRMVGSTGAAVEFAAEHALSRSVRDSARLFAWNERRDPQTPLAAVGWIAGPSDRKYRIALATADMFGIEPTAQGRSAIDHVARVCEKLGHFVEPARAPINGAEFLPHFMVVWSAGADRAVKRAEAGGADLARVLEPWTLYLSGHFRRQPVDALAAAFAYFAVLESRWRVFFASHDLLLTPVTHDVPPLLGYLDPRVAGAVLWQRMTRYAAYTAVHNAIGTPAMSVPIANSGLPIGGQFAAARGNERALFDLAYQIEGTAAWRHGWPRLSSAAWA